MEQKLYLNPDIILRIKNNAWVASNPRLRTHVELSDLASKALVEAGEGQASWEQRLSEAKGRDRSVRGIGEKGLVSDHSCFQDKEKDNWVNGKELLNLLIKNKILIKSRADALAPIKLLTGVLDKENLGSFHQRVGQFILLDRRAKEPWREWQNQKFSLDGKELLNNSYKFIQEPFFDEYFSADKMKGLKVLDFGCGNAYYSAKMAKNGAHVIGLDNSAELLIIAQDNHGTLKNLELKLTNSFDEVMSLLNSYGPESLDLIYLQDTLLLLLRPETEKPSDMLPALFQKFSQVLKKDGRLCAMEPNSTFWLCNRFGDSETPYAVITEYRNPVFNVAPTLDVLLAFMSSNGFALKNLIHPKPTSPEQNKDFGFQNEFPIWDFYEFIPLK